MTEINIHNGDCLPFLKTLPDNCVDLVATDPPYEISNVDPGESWMTYKLQKNLDDLKGSEIISGFDPAILDELVRINNGINMYFWCNKTQIPMYFEYFLPLGCAFDILKWIKTNPLPTYHNKRVQDTEYCMYFRKGGMCKPQNIREGLTYWLAPTNGKDKKTFGHPTCKPQQFIEDIIRVSSTEGQTVIDPFMGSGTTGRAAKLLGRNFIGCEISKKWFEVAETRIATGLNNKDQMVLF